MIGVGCRRQVDLRLGRDGKDGCQGGKGLAARIICTENEIERSGGSSELTYRPDASVVALPIAVSLLSCNATSATGMFAIGAPSPSTSCPCTVPRGRTMLGVAPPPVGVGCRTASVAASTIPVAGNPRYVWKARSAASVEAPNCSWWSSARSIVWPFNVRIFCN
jgi:hypothetical protein